MLFNKQLAKLLTRSTSVASIGGMSNLQHIRKRLGVSQNELASAIGVTQGVISHCEVGRQEVMPNMARMVIDFAAAKGVVITFDDVYAPIIDVKRVA